MYMPTVLRVFSFLWIIHTNDHEPAHVTVYKGTPDNYEAKARIEIVTGRVIDSEGLKSSALEKMSTVTIEFRELLQERWNETRPQK